MNYFLRSVSSSNDSISAFLLSVVWIALSFLCSCASRDQPDRFIEARQYMVTEYIEREGVKDRRVLAAMEAVPRHEFVSHRYRKNAYLDEPLMIGNKQTISPPYIVAYMTETLAPKASDVVLEVGTGSGYQAAVLSHLVKEVYTIEIVEPLGRKAAQRLKRLEYDNVFSRIGDGYAGWPEHAPFDKIIVTCSPENIPKPLIAQLKEGGKMLIPLGEHYQQTFQVIEKKNGRLERRSLRATMFVPMTGTSEDLRKIQSDSSHPQLRNGSFERHGNRVGLPDGWHSQRMTELVHGGAPEGRRFLRIANSEPGRVAKALQLVAIDGRKVASLEISARVRTENIRSDGNRFQQPRIAVRFFNDRLKHLGTEVIGSWGTNRPWEKVARTIQVPRNARSVEIRIELTGSTGRLDVDEVEFHSTPR